MPKIPEITPTTRGGKVDTLGHVCGLVLGAAPVLGFLAAVLGVGVLVKISVAALFLGVLGAVVLTMRAEDRREALAKTIRDPFWLLGVGLIALWLILFR